MHRIFCETLLWKSVIIWEDPYPHWAFSKNDYISFRCHDNFGIRDNYVTKKMQSCTCVYMCVCHLRQMHTIYMPNALNGQNLWQVSQDELFVAIYYTELAIWGLRLCSSDSYSKATFAIQKLANFWARPIKIIYPSPPQSNALSGTCKKNPFLSRKNILETASAHLWLHTVAYCGCKCIFRGGREGGRGCEVLCPENVTYRRRDSVLSVYHLCSDQVVSGFT